MPKPDPSRNAPDEVDDYIRSQPAEVQESLERVRRIVHELVPECTERVSYRIPIFRLGRDLIGMSASAKHCSLHTMSPALARALKTEFAELEISGATVHFTPAAPLPERLIERVVRTRLDATRA